MATLSVAKPYDVVAVEWQAKKTSLAETDVIFVHMSTKNAIRILFDTWHDGLLKQLANISGVVEIVTDQDFLEGKVTFSKHKSNTNGLSDRPT
jgi:hypothetical protein